MSAEFAPSQVVNAGFRQPPREGFPGSARGSYDKALADGNRKAMEVAAARTAFRDAAPNHYRPPIDQTPLDPMKLRPVAENALAGVDPQVQRKTNEAVWEERRKRNERRRAAVRVEKGEWDVQTMAKALNEDVLDSELTLLSREHVRRRGSVSIGTVDSTVPTGLVGVTNEDYEPASPSENPSKKDLVAFRVASQPARGAGREIFDRVRAMVREGGSGVGEVPTSWIDDLPEGVQLVASTNGSSVVRVLTKA